MSTLYVFCGIFSWLENHLLPCWFKTIFHVECPGCGFQRSLLSLLKGDLAKSFELYPMTIPVLLFFLFVALHIKYNFKRGAKYIRVFYIVLAILIAAGYIYKLLHNHQ